MLVSTNFLLSWLQWNLCVPGFSSGFSEKPTAWRIKIQQHAHQHQCQKKGANVSETLGYRNEKLRGLAVVIMRSMWHSHK